MLGRWLIGRRLPGLEAIGEKSENDSAALAPAPNKQARQATRVTGKRRGRQGQVDDIWGALVELWSPSPWEAWDDLGQARLAFEDVKVC